MAKEFPGTDIKGTPHINSKLQTWKRNYMSLCQMMNRSGVGFNANGTYVIECNQDQWDQIVKMDANAKSMRYKSWPLFEEWQEIFGKDRVVGESADDVIEMVNEMIQGDNRAEDEKQEDGDYHPTNLEDIHMDDDVGENSVCNSDKVEAASKKSEKGKEKGKKRKALDGVQGVAVVLQEMGRNTNARLDTIASRIGYEYDLDQAKKDAFALLDNISGLTLDQKFDVCEIFADIPERLMIFKGLPEAARPPYVTRLLKSKHT